jgi:diguanylate cyclase (GGDEF)-like protein
MPANQSADDRDLAAKLRDRRASSDDLASDSRDRIATARDQVAEAREIAAGGIDIDASLARKEALEDRRGGASDRTQAAGDRAAASKDRLSSADDRAVSFIDGLTGVHRREAGVLELEREILKAKRTNASLSLVFVDVDGLKKVNDNLGHAAGDQLLVTVANTMRMHLRSYDLLIRFGGDEFVCALADVSLAEARDRFDLVNQSLAKENASVTFGITALDKSDRLEHLIARADELMYAKRKNR